jgi:hypothetical protein
MSDSVVDSAVGATTGLLAIGIMASVAGRVMDGLNKTKDKGGDWLSSKSSSGNNKSKGGNW